MNYLSSYPKLDLFYLTIPWSQKRVDFFDYDYYKNYFKLLEKIWMTCGEEELDKELKDFNLNEIIKKIETESSKLYQLEKKINNLSFDDEDLKIIQKGYMGVGANYFVGYKQDRDFENKFSNIVIK